MSQITPEPPTVPPADRSMTAASTPMAGTPTRVPSAAWQNWAYFGAVVMALIGFFQAILGLIALVDEEYFTFRENSLVAASNYQAWGWVHLIAGVAAVAAGVGILVAGHRWARATGVVVAALSAVVNLGFLAASPVWSTLVIALDVLVIYALTVHGWEIDNS